MKEQLKSMVLFLLVLSSLIQSYFLIYRLPGGDSIISSETNYVKTDSMGQEQRIEQLIFPNKIIVHMGEDKHTVFYPETTFYKLIFTRLESRSFQSFERRSIQSANWSEVRRKYEGIEMVFSGGVPVTLLERMMRLTADPVFQAETINRIWVYTDEKATRTHALFFSARGDVVYEAKEVDLTVQDVQQHVSFGQNATPYELISGQYYIPMDNIEMQEPIVNSGLFTTEQMQRNLFFDPGITRNIQEKDGSEIYTDSKRSLQVKQSQRWMGYTDPAAPSSEPGNPVRDILAAVDFVNQHGGWDGAYRLIMNNASDVSGEEYRTNVSFQQYYGSYPVLDRPSFRFGTIRLEVQQETASVYERSLLYLKGGEQSSASMLLPGGEELRVKLKQLAGNKTILDVTPSYSPELTEDGSLKLVPVWRIQLLNGGIQTIQAMPAPQPPVSGTIP